MRFSWWCIYLCICCHSSFEVSWPASDIFARETESLQIKSLDTFLKVQPLSRRQTSKLTLHWRKGRRGRWTVLLDPGESTQDALTTGKALFSSCPLLALDNQPQNIEPQETRQHNFYCSQQCSFLAEEIQVVPLVQDTRVTSHHRCYAAALGCCVGCNFFRSLSHFSSMYMHLSGCLQPVLWNFFFPTPLVFL